MNRIRSPLFLLLVLVAIPGCSRFGGGRSTESHRLLSTEEVKRTGITEDSRELLLRENLLADYEVNAETTLKELIGRVLADPQKQADPRSLFCCAELANAVAERNTSRWNRNPVIHPRTETSRWSMRGRERMARFLENNEAVLTYYKMAVYLSYSYIAFAHQKQETELYTPRFRRGCDLYNYALSQTIRYGLTRTPYNPESESRLDEFAVGSEIPVELSGFDWSRNDVDDLLMAADYIPEEVSLKSRRYGLGVPMIGIRYGDDNGAKGFYPPIATFPITALYIPGETYDLEATEIQERIILVNPWNQETIKVGPSTLPVEADLTTPLNYMLREAGFKQNIWEGYIAGETDFEGGVNLLQPHQPGRTPIVLIHGLLGSPVSWEVFMNGLMDDPWIRQKYEFWFARYPTGKSFLHNTRALRESLVRLKSELDPTGDDPELNRMVLVGHSMGGVLSTMLTHDSGTQFWDMVWDVPIDQLDLTPDQRRELESLFFFERLSFVDTVFYLAAPHRGAPLAKRPIGRIGSRLTDLPDQARASLKAVSDRNQHHAKVRLTEQSFNSTHDLRPDSPPIRALQSLQRPQGVTFYNFAGNIEGDRGEGSDGIVPLPSARLPDAAFEKVVPARHREIHSHPEVIREVARILKQRLQGEEDAPVAAPRRIPTISEIESELSSQ